MGPEKEQEVRAWLEKAKSDLAAARVLIKGEPPCLDAAVYHCQQCAEKALKAWLVLLDVPFVKTHDLEHLLVLAQGAESEHEDLERHARILTPYAVAFRYPGDVLAPSREEALVALELASELFERISGHLHEKMGS